MTVKKCGKIARFGKQPAHGPGRKYRKYRPAKPANQKHTHYTEKETDEQRVFSHTSGVARRGVTGER